MNEKVAVIGGGQMGSQIAALAAMAKTPRIHIIDHLTAMTMIQFNGSINF